MTTTLVNITVLERRSFAWQNAKSATASGSDDDRRRFWAKVRVVESDTACQEWVGGRTSNGRYGQFTWASRYGRNHPIGAHCAAWELMVGEIPAGLHVLHSCDNGFCVNPKHLFLGTHTDNMQDAAQKGRLHVPRPKGQKLTPEQLVEIDSMIAAGAKQVDAARRFNVSKTLICLYLKGKRRQYDAPRRREQVA